MHCVPSIVAVCGAKRSGKDTIADILVKHHGYRKLRIAHDLKRAVCQLFGFTEEQVEDDQKDVIDPRWNISPRAALQFMGTEVLQHHIQELLPGIGRRFLINNVVNEINRIKATEPSVRFVIPDLRFMHEYHALMNAASDTYIIKMHRPGIAFTLDAASAHVSEKEYVTIPCDLEVQNTDIKRLHEQILGALSPGTSSPLHEVQQLEPALG